MYLHYIRKIAINKFKKVFISNENELDLANIRTCKEEIQDEKLMVYILSKVYNFFLSCFALRNEHPPPLTKINMICAHYVFPS